MHSPERLHFAHGADHPFGMVIEWSPHLSWYVIDFTNIAMNSLHVSSIFDLSW